MLSEYKVHLDTQEGMLIDWIFTMHSYSSDYTEYVMKSSIQEMRYQAGKVIIEDGGDLELSETDLKWLLAVVPITFRFGREDVGYSLKKKLFEAYLKVDLDKLMKEVNENARESSNQTNRETGSEDIPGSPS